jgi:hypothetical protein
MNGDVERKRMRQYRQNVMGIGGRFLDGKDALVAKNLKKWPPIYDKTTEEMWADVTAYLAETLPDLMQEQRTIEKHKRWGKETYYNFTLARRKLPIDEALEKIKARIERCKSAPVKAPVGEEGLKC